LPEESGVSTGSRIHLLFAYNDNTFSTKYDNYSKRVLSISLKQSRVSFSQTLRNKKIEIIDIEIVLRR